METLVSSGLVADIVLGCLVLEGVGLFAWRLLLGRGLPLREVLSLLLPGAFLVLALRFALTGAPWGLIPVMLVGALVAHLLDLSRRLRREDRGG